MTAAVADTHAVLWYLAGDERLSPAAQRACVAAQTGAGLIISAITLVEVRYLAEKQRIPAMALDRLHQALDSGEGLRVADLGRDVADHLPSVPREQVPDMPDRIIAATAVSLGLPLISRDRKIVASGVETIW